MFIRAAASISPQSSFEQLLKTPSIPEGNRLTCIEPDYAAVIDAKMIRRMSRIVRMGVAAAMDCLKRGETEMPGAIITGTAYGCLADTELFLTKMIEQNEALLTPTAFIQSTHNTVGAQIALLLKCHHYNNTFVHRGSSFESALLDGITLLKEKQASDVLVGGIDEITPTSHTLLSRFGLFRQSNSDHASVNDHQRYGAIDGEGTSFFLLSAQSSDNDFAELKGLYTFYKPSTQREIEVHFSRFLVEQNMSPRDIDLVITGHSGNAKHDVVYDRFLKSIDPAKPAVGFKHLCGEYPTASSFALWLGSNILRSGAIPDSGRINNRNSIQSPKRILIYNHYQNSYHAFYMLSAC
ncbi:MAG: beta-ketoacyl synthase chain length factor [Chitinophagaceae bacterium]|nr:beta-ketoacyl synthase chain length factor [Chitinophagaceae bacterium]